MSGGQVVRGPGLIYPAHSAKESEWPAHVSARGYDCRQTCVGKTSR